MRTVTASPRSRPRMATLRKQVHGPTPLTRRQLATLASRSATTQAIWRMAPKESFFMQDSGCARRRARRARRLPLDSGDPQPRAPGEGADGEARVRVLAWPAERCQPE